MRKKLYRVMQEQKRTKNVKSTRTWGQKVSCKTNITGNNKLEKKQPNKKSEILINAIMRAKELNFVYLAEK